VADNGRQKVHVITMGCAKNIVDSEKLMAQLQLSGIEVTPHIEDADIAVINTCGFIDAAKEESIDTIIDTVRLKAGGKLKTVYAMGCLTERYRVDLTKEIPEVDRFFGTHEMKEILESLGAEYRYELLGERHLTTPGHVAYLKISEGCDNPCSFCAIPLMRGTHVSRPVEEIVSEAHSLVARGVKELIVIGQDTTSYGLDLYGRRRLSYLLESIADLEGVEWVRLMYAYPAKFPRDVLEVIARHPKLCRYIDIPLQHIADPILRSMRRGITSRATRELIEAIREKVPGVTLRTTLIVGYPEEGPREFDELAEFVRTTAFERLGVFAYSREDGTPAFPLGDPVPDTEKQRRQGVLMELQQEISERHNEQLLNTRQRVLVDRREGEGYAGRTQSDAPEIDNEVLIRVSRPLQVGTFYDVDIVDTYEYDLVGIIA
jgi:ribosomal protein S12 methylthiotransferase